MSKYLPLAVLAAAVLAGVLGGGWSVAAPAAAAELRPSSAFASIQNDRQRSIALFEEAGKVLLHPRCVNCHPAGDRPLQGEDSRLHQPFVQRPESASSVAGTNCGTCHQQANFDPARVPGHPAWRLAPIEMAWEGRSLGFICKQIKDPERNGGKSLADIVEHNAHDSLVGYGWNPGAGREPAPGNQKIFGELIKAWADSGAVCPPR